MTQRFLTAAAADPPALRVDWQPDALRRVEAVVSAGGVLLVGEVHGVAENAAVAHTLLRRFGIRQLSLEWPPSLRPQIETFVGSGALDLAPLAGLVDGRVTAQHYALLRRLYRAAALDGLLLVDVPLEVPADAPQNGAGWRWNRRDAAMAGALRADRIPGAAVLHCGGNWHTGTAPFRADLGGGVEVELQPMGAVLARSGVPVLTVEIDYRSGSYFNVTTRRFADRPLAGPLLAATDGDGLQFVLPVATPALPRPRRLVSGGCPPDPPRSAARPPAAEGPGWSGG